MSKIRLFIITLLYIVSFRIARKQLERKIRKNG